MVRRALVNTLLLAVGGGALAMAFTTAVAYIVTRTHYRLRPALDLAVWVPWTLPASSWAWRCCGRTSACRACAACMARHGCC